MPSEIENEKFILNHIISPELYFDSIRVYFDFSGVTNRNIRAKLETQLNDLKKYLPILHNKIAELAHQAVLTNGPIVIKFSNLKETTGSPGTWNASKKEINIDYKQEHFSLLQVIGFELCNANNKVFDDLIQSIEASEYIYSNSIKKILHKMDIKIFKAQLLSYKKLKQIFGNYFQYTNKLPNNEIEEYVSHYKDVTDISDHVSNLYSKDFIVEEYSKKLPEHLESCIKNLFHIIVMHNCVITQREVDIKKFTNYVADLIYLKDLVEGNFLDDPLSVHQWLNNPNQEFYIDSLGDNYQNQNN